VRRLAGHARSGSRAKTAPLGTTLHGSRGVWNGEGPELVHPNWWIDEFEKMGQESLGDVKQCRISRRDLRLPDGR
jgi:hypothetical protein